MLKRWIAKLRGDLPDDHIFDHYLILLKSARRCAYDLRHAGSNLSCYPDDGLRPDYYDMAHGWLRIFAPDGIKNYRLDLHQEIFRLESQVKTLEKLCRDNGIDPGVTSWGS